MRRIRCSPQCSSTAWCAAVASCCGCLISLQVALKIVKHAKESMPYLVTGQLLGLDIGTNLEVTNCFPFPSRGEREEQEDPDSESVVEYQWEMMKCLRDVNVDNNTVGWY